MNKIILITLCFSSLLSASSLIDSRDTELCQERQLKETLRDMESEKRPYNRTDSMQDRKKNECSMKQMQARRELTHK